MKNAIKKFDNVVGYTSSLSESTGTKSFWLYGVVGLDINVQALIRELNQLPAGVSKLEFYMHSPGGLVYEGYALLTNLVRLRSQYQTVGYIDGIAASMMSAIAVSFDKLYASPYSKMIIHDPMVHMDIYGNYNRKRIKELKEMLDSFEETLEGDADILASVYAKKTGLPVEQINKDWLEDGLNHDFTPDQMVEIGLVDGIVEELPQGVPAEMIEVEEDQWLTETMMHMKVAAIAGTKQDIYRGPKEKNIMEFSFVKNFDKLLKVVKRDSPQKEPSPMKIYATLAKRFGVEESVVQNVITSYESTVATELKQVKNEVTRLEGLVAEAKTSRTKKEAEIKALQGKLRESKVSSVVAEVIEKAQKDQKNMVVNKKVTDRIQALALDFLGYQEEEEAQKAENTMEHMELLASNNLIPTGEDPNLTGSGGNSVTAATTTTTGQLSEEEIKLAEQEGKALLEKDKARWAKLQQN